MNNQIISVWIAPDTEVCFPASRVCWWHYYHSRCPMLYIHLVGSNQPIKLSGDVARNIHLFLKEQQLKHQQN